MVSTTLNHPHRCLSKVEGYAQPPGIDYAQPPGFDYAQPPGFDSAQPPGFDSAQPPGRCLAESKTKKRRGGDAERDYLKKRFGLSFGCPCVEVRGKLRFLVKI